MLAAHTDTQTQAAATHAAHTNAQTQAAHTDIQTQAAETHAAHTNAQTQAAHTDAQIQAAETHAAHTNTQTQAAQSDFCKRERALVFIHSRRQDAALAQSVRLYTHTRGALLLRPLSEVLGAGLAS